MKTLLFLLLTASVAWAQQPASPPSPLSKKEQAEIRELARKKIENLQDLFNTITFVDASEYDINAVVKNSFLPNTNQLFLNDAIIIEDDIDPQHTGIGTPVDIPVETYLGNLNLFYTKMDKPSVVFTDIIARNEQAGTRPLVKVYFTSTFGSKNNRVDKPYQPTQRVAEFQVERVGKTWSVLITRVGFATAASPPPPPPPPPPPHRSGKGWLFVAGGVASFVGGYLLYDKLSTDYQAYKSRINALNTEYGQWQELSRQPQSSPLTPMSLPTYAGPSGYAVYGAGAAGLGLSITGISKLIKAKKRIRQTAAAASVAAN